MQKIPKSAQLLAVIAKRDIVRHGNIIKDQALLEMFSDTRTTTPSRRIADTASLLAKQGFLSVGIIDSQKVYTITKKGREKVNRAEAMKSVITSDRWDGRYYLVTFDIPENKKVVRNQIIIDLKRAGFINYSKGIWLSPYNPIGYIESVRKRYDLKKNIKLIVASHLEDEAKIKRHFKLVS